MDMITHHKIVIGDSRKMDLVGDNSVHLVITSPPYWQLKDYGNGNQIGFDDSYEDYINNLNLVWNECYRVLENGCRLCVNIGDQFARSVYYGRYKVIPIRTEIIKFCETIGFDYMGSIIWQKVTTTHTTGGATVMGSYPYPRNGILKLDYEFILIFKKGGKPKKVDEKRKLESKLTNEEWNEYFTGHWNFPGERQDRHLAMFPLELPNRLVKMFSFVEDVVLDPFLGSGTTSLSTLNLNRNSIGYEMNHEFLSTIKQKLGIDRPEIFRKAEFEIIHNQDKQIDLEAEMKKLPHIFSDPVKMDKRIDPKKLQFGSRIDKNSKSDIEYYSVKQIISPDRVELNNGLQVKLLGVKPIKNKSDGAIKFLREKTKNQKVFLKFDEMKYDHDDNLLCYLYLENKTFLNAHLIKTGLVSIDREHNYKFKNRFLSY